MPLQTIILIYPIDVKKGRGVLNSLEKFANHNKFTFAIKVSKNNYGFNAEQKLLTVPFYFFPFVAQDLAAGSLKPGLIQGTDSRGMTD